MSRELLTRLINAVLAGSAGQSGAVSAQVSENAIQALRSGSLSTFASSVTDTIGISSAASGFQLRVRFLGLTAISGVSDYTYRLFSASTPRANFQFGVKQYVGFNFDNYYYTVPSGGELGLVRDEGAGKVAVSLAWTIHPNTDPA